MTLLGKSVLEIKNLIEKKEVSLREVFKYFLKRVKNYNPELNCFLTLNDRLPDRTIENGLLSGIPIAVKDNFCTKGIKTTASSKVLENFIPPYNATVVQKLIEQGVLIIGKTNMDAWAHGSSTETSDYGPTKNPWDLTRAPGGSSGGSTAAVSAYLSPAAIGSETAGSIRQPAAWCGVVGLKPTYGRISRYGLIAMGSSLDCPGPITINVTDSAFLLQILAGKDKYDATTANIKVPDYLSLIKKPKKFIIGICDDYLDGVNDEIKSNFLATLKIFEKLGHKVKKVNLISPKYAISVYTIIQRAEVSSNLARYDGIRFGNGRNFFGEEAKKRIMLGTFTLSYGYYEDFYQRAQKVRTLIVNDFKKVFDKVDLIISPTTPITALRLGEFKKYPFFGEVMDVLNEPASVAGLPAINIPTGLDSKNLPIGLQIIGRHFDEESILNLAYQFEKETDFFGVIKKGFKNYPDI